jgi:hypothetical protein
MKNRLGIFASLPLLTFAACGGSTGASTDTTETVTPVSISGSLNGNAISIKGGACQGFKNSEGAYIVTAASEENPSFPQGIILIFSDLTAVEIGEYTLPDDRLQAGYDFLTLATSGVVSITSVSKTTEALRAVGGTATFTFDTGTVSGTFDCTFATETE